MPNMIAAHADDLFADGEEPLRLDAQVINIDDVAARRERLAAYAEATRPLIVYRFVIAEDARVPALGPSGELRDARGQLQMIVGLTGGSVGKSHGGLSARIPCILAPRFESLARPLIEAFLVALDLGEAG